MQRREFSALLGLTALPTLSLAQGQAPVEGRQFLRLSPPQPQPAGKIEVLEFFLYTCPHCFAFDPSLLQWQRQLPPDVVFRRVHGGFNAITKLLQRLYFTLEALGKLPELHERVFAAIHVERVDLSSEDEIFKLMGRFGQDVAKFKLAFNSFGVQSKCLAADKLSENYHIESVPTVCVGGRFVTSPSMAGTRGMSDVQAGQATIPVVNQLIQMVRNKA
jgi:thiol:disulfide interchange protein DsbA